MRAFRTTAVFVGLLHAMLIGGCEVVKILTTPAEVHFETDKSVARVGESVEVRFLALRAGDGRRYWVGIVPEAQSFADIAGTLEIPPETPRTVVSAASAGPSEVRVYSDRGGSVNIAARRKIRIDP